MAAGASILAACSSASANLTAPAVSSGTTVVSSSAVRPPSGTAAGSSTTSGASTSSPTGAPTTGGPTTASTGASASGSIGGLAAADAGRSACGVALPATSGASGGSVGSVGAPAPTQPPGSASPTPPPVAPLSARLAERLADPRFAGSDLGASVWVDGLGTVASVQADAPLLPASNQKLLTALGALELFPPETTFATKVLATGPVVGGVVQGDLVLVGGGDATVATHGPHSLAELTDQLLLQGVRGLTGGVVADDSRYPTAWSAPGWRDGDVPGSSGPLSSLMVDHNEYRGDDEFLAAPILADGDLFRAVLAGAGIVAGIPTRLGVAPDTATVVASLTSPTVPELVQSMLRDSDNEIAELLTREAGLLVSGVGTTAAGTAALEDAMRGLCDGRLGPWADGSGLSRTNRVSARELRDLLLAARDADVWPTVAAGLPVGGVSGTLRNRYAGTAAEGNVRAKTGYLDDAVALSGTLVTRGGRTAVFSVLVGGPDAANGIAAIDDLVVALAEDTT